jgi:anti-sigma regulatory factor (Ser/Thr protein kinase)
VQSHLLDDKASLSKIRKLIRLELVRVGARPSAVFDCLVAVTEACSSALRGRSEQLGEPSRVMWTIERDRAEFCVEDHSVLTEPDDEDEERPRRRLHEILEEETGLTNLGDDVIQGLMDEVTVEKNPDGTVTKMVKSLR